MHTIVKSFIHKRASDVRFPAFWSAFGFGLSLGLGYVAWLLPADFLLGRSGLWTIGDPGAHVSALQAYLADSWHWPPLKTVYLNYPQGVNAAFADILPIAALPAKLFRAWLPPNFHYFGYWIAFAYMLQGAMAAVLLYVMGGRKWSWLFFGVAIFLLSPAMLFRVHAHTALTTHAYILCALLLYFLMARREIAFWRGAIAYIALGSVSLLTHPYFYAMVQPIFLASLIDRSLVEQHWQRVLAAIVLSAFSTLLLLWLGGYLTQGAATLSGGGGFGFNSMNLVAPVMGGAWFDVAAWRDTTGMYGHWPMPYNATGGQFEGYNHLGLGVALALLGTGIVRWRWLIGCFRRYPALSMTMVSFVFYAASSRAYFADRLLWSFDLPPALAVLAEQFRASGRFFWPVGYLLILVALVSILKMRANTAVAMSLGALLTVQFIDTAPLRAMTREATTTLPSASMNDEWWRQQIERATVLYLFPTFGCGAAPFEEVVPLQRLAAAHRVPFNTGLLARGYSSCADKETELNRGLRPGNMYVFLSSQYDWEMIEKRFGADVVAARCHAFERGLVCIP